MSPKARSWAYCYSLYIPMISHLVSSPAHASLLMTVSCIDDQLLSRCQCTPAGPRQPTAVGKELAMKCNPDKCEVIRITNKRQVVDSEDTIHGQILRRTDKAKYLGVTIDSILVWNHHIDTITKKANNATAFLRWNCPPDVKATSYKALVHPQLE